MIYVDRSQVDNPLDPSTKLGERAIKETAKTAEQMERGEFRQRRLHIVTYSHSSVRDALSQLFHDKCAYCECKIGAGAPLDVEQYRPMSAVAENSEHPGYWWLANMWVNLLAACHDCNRVRSHKSVSLDIGNPGSANSKSGKGNRFPLMDESYRAMGPQDDLSLERPLLLDPTTDDPTQYLLFDDHGLAHGLNERGNVTVELLGLNRPSLVEARLKTIQRFDTAFHRLVNDPETTNDPKRQDFLQYANEIAAMLAPEAEYAGAVRQRAREKRLEKNHPLYDWLLGITSGERVSRSQIRAAQRQSSDFWEQMSDYALDTEEGVGKFKAQDRFIERVQIKNIRAIRTLDLNLTENVQGPASWLMLLGENGTGKSTVLQAISLVLAGPEQVCRLMKSEQLDLGSMVRYRCKSGQIRVKLNGFSKPHDLTVFPDRLEFESPNGHRMIIWGGEAPKSEGRWDEQVLLLGYGATRLLPRKTDHMPPTGRFTRVDNLFDAFVPLIDAKAWLLGLKRKEFDETAIVLKNLLSLGENNQLIRRSGEIFIDIEKNRTRLQDLSDGYRSVMAMAADMLDVLSRIWPNMSEARGVVLIDELDAHLHPTWQMRVVGALREAFPSVQFIATTHQPLCLRGLEEGEVIVMQRDESGLITPETNLPSPKDLRVGQLLTSPMFGLRSTIDPDLERQFTQYYKLLAISERNGEEEAELKELTKLLDDRRYLGDSYRESVFYKAVDKKLAAQESALSRLSPSDLQQQIIDDVSALWDEVLDEEGEAS